MSTSLNEKYDQYYKRFAHHPSITQFRLFANIKYVEAKNYIQSKSHKRRSSVDLPSPSKLRPSAKPRAYTSVHSISKPITKASTSYHELPTYEHNVNLCTSETLPEPNTNNLSSSTRIIDIISKPPSLSHAVSQNNLSSANNTANKHESDSSDHESIADVAPTTPPRTKLRKSLSAPFSQTAYDNSMNSNTKKTLTPSRYQNRNTKNRVNLSVTKSEKDGYIYFNENYCHSKSAAKNNPNLKVNGQDLRKYSGIDANDHNGYYHDMDYKNDIRSNINNPYLDQTVLKSLEIHTFKLYVAIDFGTDGCSISYCLPNGKVYVHSNWRGEKLNKVDVNTKVKSRVLLDKYGQRLAFGFAASYMYSNINKNNNQKWMLFERFKMNLREQIAATNGTLYESQRVFVSVFQFMKEQVWFYLKKLKLHHSVKCIQDIQWIITVPAIFDDVAKNKMREWAFAAGLADEMIPNHIKIVYEPDCASLSVQHKIMEIQTNKDVVYEPLILVDDTRNIRDMQHLFEIGSRYILVDAGGGTADVSCHQSMGNMKIKEVLCPSGDNWGSCKIDDAFMKLLDNIFTAQWMKEFIDEDSHSYYQLLNNFRSAKHFFYYNDKSKSKHCVDLTYAFISFIEEQCEKHEMLLDNIISNCIYSSQIKLHGEYLELSFNIWSKVLFGVIVDPIIKHVDGLLNRDEMKQCKYICLVGGLSESKYFQYRMKQTFGDKVALIIPAKPILSVVEGAALFGLFNKFVQARVLSKCYGTCVNSQNLNKSWMNHKMVANLTDEQKQNHYNYKRQCYSKIFKPIVYKNQIVSIDGKPIIVEGARNTSNKAQKHTTVKIYQCDEYNDSSNTFFINTDGANNDNMKLMATACIVWPKDDKQRNKIILELYFHDTTIRGYVYAEKAPDDKKILQLKYEFQ